MCRLCNPGCIVVALGPWPPKALNSSLSQTHTLLLSPSDAWLTSFPVGSPVGLVKALRLRNMSCDVCDREFAENWYLSRRFLMEITVFYCVQAAGTLHYRDDFYCVLSMEMLKTVF